MIIHIVGVGAVYNGAVASPLRVVYQFIIHVALAEIAAIWRVGQVTWVFCLVTVDQHVASAHPYGNGLGFLQFVGRQAG